MTNNYIFFNINRYLILTIRKMKQIEVKNKKNVLVSSFTKFFRVGILSLFVMLVIPSISSGIFGNGDAKAGCVPIEATTPTFQITDAIARTPSFCGGSETEPCAIAALNIGIGGANICLSTTNECSAQLTVNIACNSLTSVQCKEVLSTCQFVADTVNDNKLVDAVCRVYLIATGTAGKAFAAVGVISVGIGFFTGKVSWGLMISVAAGIAVFFGAPSIIAVISGDQNATSLCSNVR
ncbi:MAG: type IV secretory pathway VirB2 component (pilin) [Rickettsiales bacterium]